MNRKKKTASINYLLPSYDTQYVPPVLSRQTVAEGQSRSCGAQTQWPLQV